MPAQHPQEPLTHRELQALYDIGCGRYFDLGQACEAYRISHARLLRKLKYQRDHTTH